MPTLILPMHKYRFDGTALKHQRFSPIFLFLTVLFAVVFVFSPESALPTYAQDSQTSVRAPVKDPEPPKHVKIAQYIKNVNADLSEADVQNFALYTVESAKTFRLDVAVLLALIKIESQFKPEAASNMGALGLTQVIPKWHATRIAEARKRLNAYSIYEPKLNIYVGAWALRMFMDESKDLRSGLLRYNGSLSDPTQAYAKVVLEEAYNIRIKFLTDQKL